MQVIKARICLLVCLFLSPLVSASVDYDVLELPSAKSDIASKSLVYSLAAFGDRIYAAGQRGHILYSDDDGESWTQADVPVRVAILDIFFVDADYGWAVGHGGVILHSYNGGETWEKQYDGFRFGAEGLKYYQEQSAADPENEILSGLIYEMEYAVSQGADKPFFKVYFKDKNHGYAFGAYGAFLKTSDGGQNWEHFMHSVENDSYYHLFDFTHIKGDRFLINGEAGLLFSADASTEYTTSIENSPYEGSFFTSVTGKSGSLVVGGLRGFTFVSMDEGQTWQESEKPVTGSIVDSITLKDGSIVLASLTGVLLMSQDEGVSFQRLNTPKVGPVFALVETSEGSLLVAGPRGIIKLPLAK